MQTLTKLKQEREFAVDMEGIIDTFKMAALIQFRIFQDKKNINDGFFEELEACIALLRLAPPELKGQAPALGRRAVVAITSDAGFLGDLNTLIVNTAIDSCSDGKAAIIVLGDAGARYMEEMKQDFVCFPGLSDDLGYGQVEGLRHHLLSGFGKDFDKVDIFYPQFVSLSEQKIKKAPLLPCVLETGHSPVEMHRDEIMPEPSWESLDREIRELWLGFRLSEIFRSAKQSEYAARIMHLEGSSEEISHLKHNLNLSYFRQMHSLSDKSIREISAAKAMLKKR